MDGRKSTRSTDWVLQIYFWIVADPSSVLSPVSFVISGSDSVSTSAGWAALQCLFQAWWALLAILWTWCRFFTTRSIFFELLLPRACWQDHPGNATAAVKSIKKIIKAFFLMQTSNACKTSIKTGLTFDGLHNFWRFNASVASLWWTLYYSIV